MSKRKHEDLREQQSSTSRSSQIYESTPIHDRSSTFIAVFTPSTDAPRTIQSHVPFADASHKILAWRKPSAQRSIAGSFGTRISAAGLSPADSADGGRGNAKVVYETGSDDDGEKYAGKKLERLLTDMNVQGTVVVARWYGGILLGPVRFKWIEDSAKEAILKWKASLDGGRGISDSGSGSGSGNEAKKMKVDDTCDIDEATAKASLIRTLKERDASVDVLRALMTEKNEMLKRKEAGQDDGDIVASTTPGDIAKGSTVKAPDYDSMSLQQLKRTEKGRDATLAWILKQIDRIEEKIENTSASAPGSRNTT